MSVQFSRSSIRPNIRPATRANVRHLVTDADHVRRGVARAILDHSIKAAKAAGAIWMHCLATRTAVPFYQAANFDVMGDMHVALAPGVDFPAIAMRRDL